MSRATTTLRESAARLLAHEAAQSKSAAAKIPTVFLACEKLRPPLATLMGKSGFRALLARALTLTCVEVSAFSALRVDPIGALEGLDQLESQVGAKEIADGSAELLAQLLGLLIAFIGESITLRLLRDAWPKLPAGDLNLSKGDKS